MSDTFSFNGKFNRESLKIFVLILLSEMCADDCLPTGEDLISFGSNGILPNLLLLAVQGVVYFAIILLLENPKIKNRTRLAALKSALQVNLPFLSNFSNLIIKEKEIPPLRLSNCSCFRIRPITG